MYLDHLKHKYHKRQKRAKTALSSIKRLQRFATKLRLSTYTNKIAKPIDFFKIKGVGLKLVSSVKSKLIKNNIKFSSLLSLANKARLRLEFKPVKKTYTNVFYVLQSSNQTAFSNQIIHFFSFRGSYLLDKKKTIANLLPIPQKKLMSSLTKLAVDAVTALRYNVESLIIFTDKVNRRKVVAA